MHSSSIDTNQFIRNASGRRVARYRTTNERRDNSSFGGAYGHVDDIKMIIEEFDRRVEHKCTQYGHVDDIKKKDH